MLPVKYNTVKTVAGDTNQIVVPMDQLSAGITDFDAYLWLFTAKVLESDLDTAAKVQKFTGTGLKFIGRQCVLDIVVADTEELPAGMLYCDIRGTHAITGAKHTGAQFLWEIEPYVGKGPAPSIPIHTTDPPAFDLSGFAKIEGGNAFIGDQLIDGNLTVTNFTELGDLTVNGISIFQQAATFNFVATFNEGANFSQPVSFDSASVVSFSAGFTATTPCFFEAGLFTPSVKAGPSEELVLGAHNTEFWKITVGGTLIPKGNNVSDIGTVANRVKTIVCTGVSASGTISGTTIQGGTVNASTALNTVGLVTQQFTHNQPGTGSTVILGLNAQGAWLTALGLSLTAGADLVDAAKQSKWNIFTNVNEFHQAIQMNFGAAVDFLDVDNNQTFTISASFMQGDTPNGGINTSIGSATFTGNVSIGFLSVEGNAQVNGNLELPSGDVILDSGNVTLSAGNLYVDGTCSVSGLSNLSQVTVGGGFTHNSANVVFGDVNVKNAWRTALGVVTTLSDTDITQEIVGRLNSFQNLPVYPTHAAADNDANLPSKHFYKRTNGRQIFQKP